MSDLADILFCDAPFDPLQADVFFARVPAKWCVACLFDATDRPLQLVCAKNLRAMLKRRLDVPDPALPTTKRVDYRELVRRVAWQRVDSEFQMDLVYIEAARVAFPVHWRQLIPERSAHFVRIDAEQTHPDFTRETAVLAGGRTWGPFPDRAKAERWIESVRDVFDLCRYRNLLVQSPHAKACTYKQMNKCPAPCDGTISLDTYRQSVRDAVASVREPEKTRDAWTNKMKTHAAALEFEQAGKLKTRLATFDEVLAIRGVRPIEAFAFISVQPGAKKGTARVYLLTPDGVTEICGVTQAMLEVEEVRRLLDAARPTNAWPGEVLMGTMCHHLASAKSGDRFVALTALNAERLAAMLNTAMKPAAVSQDAEAVRETRLQV